MCVETAITLNKKQTQTHKKHTNIKTETQRHKCKDTNIYIQHIETNKKFFKANCIEETNRNTQTQRLKHKYTSTKTQIQTYKLKDTNRKFFKTKCIEETNVWAVPLHLRGQQGKGAENTALHDCKISLANCTL